MDELVKLDRRELLKIPGIGPKGAEALIEARKTRAIRDVKQLAQLGITAARAVEFILLDGKRPALQLKLL